MADLAIPDSLIDRIRAGRAALVVGSSFGMMAGLPSWKKLLERFREELGQRGHDGDTVGAEDVAALLKKGRLVAASNYLARTLGSSACDAIVRELWHTPEKLPASARLLGQLPIKAVWTTHPGDLVERAVTVGSPADWPEVRVSSYEQAAQVDTRRRYVLKLFGDIESPDSYVVTPASVRRALAGAATYRAVLQEMYADGSLIFIGFRHGDPDLHAILDRVFASFEPPSGEHFFVGGGIGPVDTAELAAEHRMTVVPLEAGADRAADSLAAFLGALIVACEKSGISLSQSRPAANDLEGWCARLGDDPKDVEARDAILAIEKNARDSGQADRLVEVLLARVEVEDEALVRASVMRDLARTFEVEIGDLPRAFTALTAAMRENPADDEIVAEAERLAAETDGWGELIADLSEVVPHIEDKRVAAGHWVRLGRWYHEKLHHEDYAIASYREALKLDPARLDARQGLAELYRRQQKWGELAEELAVHAEVSGNADEKVELLLALGDLNETTLASTSRAIDAYERVATIDPLNDDALAALERLYRRDERWGKLATVLEKRATLAETSEPARASAFKKELAQVRADKLGDVEGAIARWEGALKADDHDLEALKGLEKLYEKVGRTDDYLRMLERYAEVGPESERPNLWRRLAAEVEDREGGAARAIRCYERVLDLEPYALDAYRSLERLYRAERSWDAVVGLYERQIASTTAPAQRLELWVALGKLYEQELHDPHRAIEAHQHALDLAPENRDSLGALARLYRRIESWDRAIAILEKHAELATAQGVTTPPRAVDLWYEAGQILMKQGDDMVAETRFAKALELDPTHVPSLLSTVELAKKRKDYARAVQLMMEAERGMQNRLEKIAILADAAYLAEDRLEQRDRAVELSLRVLALDPEHIEAGLRASRELLDKGRFAEAEPVLDMLVRKAEPHDTVELARRNTQLARAAEALGNLDKAAKHFGLAAQTDAGSLEGALGLANVLFAKKDHAGADRQLREVLARHRPALAQGQAIEIWHKIGLSARATNNASAAEDAFRRALELDPGHRASLAQIVELAGERGDWHAVVQAKRDALEGAAEEEKLRLLEEIGDLLARKLGDPVAAVGVYLEALQLRPRSHTLLHKTLEIYTAQKEWRQAIETLDKLAEMEKDVAVRAKLSYAAAVIARDELKNADEAVERFTRTLDDAPSTFKAFEAIERILGEKSDWKGLIRAYRSMIKRLGDRATAEQQLHLWTRMGDVAREKLNDTQAAIAAYEVAVTLDPTEMKRHDRLARLYLAAGPDRYDKAVAELQLLLKTFPDQLELYRSLSKVYVETRQTDKAFCLAQAMLLLGQAGPDEQRTVDLFRPRQLVLARRRLTEELWQKAILHPREDRVLGSIFGSLMASLAALTAQSHVALALNPREQSEEKDPHPVARLFRYAVQVLGITPTPELYLRPNAQSGIQAANMAEKGLLTPAILISEPQLNRKMEGENAFDVAKKLVYFRPERYVYYALPTVARLESAFEAALVVAGLVAQKKDPEVEKLVNHLRRTVPSATMEHVSSLARKHPASAGNGAIASTLGSWVTTVDLTANRVGLILSNDLETSARMVATEKGTTSTLTAKERLTELLAYSASEEYFSVRRHLGLEVGGGG